MDHRDAPDDIWYRRRLAELLGRAHAVVVFLEMFPDEIYLHALNRLESECDARGPEVTAIDGLAGDFIEAVTIALRPFARDAQIGAVVHYRNIDHAFVAAVVIITPVSREHGFELIRRFGRDDVHHARSCIAAIERSLRPAQNFNLTDVVEFLLEKVIAQE